MDSITHNHSAPFGKIDSRTLASCTRKCYSRSAKRADDKVHALSELMFNYIFEKSGTYFSIRSDESMFYDRDR
jgi:hypothetical protein